MMIKFLARGTGSAAAAADYLTREQNLAPEQDQDQDQDRDPEKNPEEVKVLRGNPHQVADVADALQFEHKYTSGVIAWAPEDIRTSVCRTSHLRQIPPQLQARVPFQARTLRGLGHVAVLDWSRRKPFETRRGPRCTLQAQANRR